MIGHRFRGSRLACCWRAACTTLVLGFGGVHLPASCLKTEASRLAWTECRGLVPPTSHKVPSLRHCPDVATWRAQSWEMMSSTPYLIPSASLPDSCKEPRAHFEGEAPGAVQLKNAETLTNNEVSRTKVPQVGLLEIKDGLLPQLHTISLT